MVPLAVSWWGFGSFFLWSPCSYSVCLFVLGWGGSCSVEPGHFCWSAEKGEASVPFPAPVWLVLWKTPAGSSLLIQSQAFRAGRAVPVFCLLLSSEHVELLLLQRRGKLAAHHHRAKPLSDAEGGAFRWRHEVPPSSFPFLSVLLCALVCQGGWGCPLLKCWNHEWIIPKIFRQSSYENQSSSSEWNIPGEMCAWGCVYFRADECPAHTSSYCSPIHGDAFESKSRAVCMRIVSSKYRKV